MIRINLAVERARPKVKRRIAVPGGVFLIYLGVAAVAGVGAEGVRSYMINQDIADVQRQIDEQKAQETELAPFRPKLEELKTNQARLEARKKVIDTLTSNKAGPVRLLEAVGSTVSVTETLWLTAMTEKGGGDVEFAGQAGSVDAVASFITALNNSGLFQNVEIKQSVQKPGRGGVVSNFDFTLSAKFSPPAPPGAAQPKEPPAEAPAGRRGARGARRG